jgi:hypothetical protein
MDGLSYFRVSSTVHVRCCQAFRWRSFPWLFAGSHTVVCLIEAGARVTIIDDLSNSFLEVLNRLKLLFGDKMSRAKFVQVLLPRPILFLSSIPVKTALVLILPHLTVIIFRKMCFICAASVGYQPMTALVLQHSVLTASIGSSSVMLHHVDGHGIHLPYLIRGYG